MYNYCTNSLLPLNVPAGLVYCGYAIMEDNSVVKTLFFQFGFATVDFQEVPLSLAIDLISEIKGIKPKYYVGVPLRQEDLERFFFQKDPDILQGLVEKDRQGRAEDRADEKDIQMMISHGMHTWRNDVDSFPLELLEYAKKEGLPTSPKR